MSIIIRKRTLKDTIEITSDSTIEFEFTEKGIAVVFTVSFLEELLLDANQEAFNRLTRTSREDFTSDGKCERNSDSK